MDALNYPVQEFIICLKEELLPIFSSVGLFMLENWLSRVKSKNKDNKPKQAAIQKGIELVNLYLAEVIEYLYRKLGTRRLTWEDQEAQEKRRKNKATNQVLVHRLHPSQLFQGAGGNAAWNCLRFLQKNPGNRQVWYVFSVQKSVLLLQGLSGKRLEEWTQVGLCEIKGEAVTYTNLFTYLMNYALSD